MTAVRPAGVREGGRRVSEDGEGTPTPGGAAGLGEVRVLCRNSASSGPASPSFLLLELSVTKPRASPGLALSEF